MDFNDDIELLDSEGWLSRATDWVTPKKNMIKRLVANGNRARDRRDWRAAAVWYRKVVEADPAYSAIWVQLGHALKEQGDRQGSEDAYRRSLALADNVADTHLQLGHVLKLRGRTLEAAESYFRALTLDRDFASARLELTGLGYSAIEIDSALAARTLPRALSVR